MDFPSDINIKIEGPYNEAIVATNKTIQMAMEGQTPEQRAALWGRYIDATKPLHELGLAITNAVVRPIIAAIEGRK